MFGILGRPSRDFKLIVLAIFAASEERENALPEPQPFTESEQRKFRLILAVLGLSY
jgi:hypothetical protein